MHEECLCYLCDPSVDKLFMEVQVVYHCKNTSTADSRAPVSDVQHVLNGFRTIWFMSHISSGNSLVVLVVVVGEGGGGVIVVGGGGGVVAGGGGGGVVAGGGVVGGGGGVVVGGGGG